MGWKSCAALALILLVILGGGRSAGALTGVIVSADEITATETDDNDWTAELDVINTGFTALLLTIEVDMVDQPTGCTITADPPTVPARRSATVEMKIPEACVDGAALDLRLGASDRGDPQEVVVTTKAKDDPLDLDPLYIGYGLGLGGSAVMTVIVCKTLKSTERDKALLGLAKDWSFKDAWVTNVGLAGAVFTGVLGTSSILEDLLGEDHGAVTAAVVSAAFTAGLLGAAPLAVGLFSKREDDANAGKHTRYPTGNGVLAGMFLVLAANLGQIGAMALLLLNERALPQVLVLVIASAAAVALWLYGGVSAHRTVTDNQDNPAATTSDDISKARNLEELLDALGIVVARVPDVATSGSEPDDALPQDASATYVWAYPPGGTSTGDSPLI